MDNMARIVAAMAMPRPVLFAFATSGDDTCNRKRQSDGTQDRCEIIDDRNPADQYRDARKHKTGDSERGHALVHTMLRLNFCLFRKRLGGGGLLGAVIRISLFSRKPRMGFLFCELPVGYDPTTCRLQGGCSAS